MIWLNNYFLFVLNSKQSKKEEENAFIVDVEDGTDIVEVVGCWCCRIECESQGRIVKIRTERIKGTCSPHIQWWKRKLLNSRSKVIKITFLFFFFLFFPSAFCSWFVCSWTDCDTTLLSSFFLIFDFFFISRRGRNCGHDWPYTSWVSKWFERRRKKRVLIPN